MFLTHMEQNNQDCSNRIKVVILTSMQLGGHETEVGAHDTGYCTWNVIIEQSQQ